MRTAAWSFALLSAAGALVVLDFLFVRALPIGFEAGFAYGSLGFVVGLGFGVASLVCWSVALLRARPAKVTSIPALLAGISVAAILAAAAIRSS